MQLQGGESLKVLVSAYACEPFKGSEQGVGWHWVKEISRFHETWVITRTNNRPVIEAEMLRHPNRALHFSYVDLPRWTSFWKRGEQGLYLYYYLWQLAVYRRSRKLHREIGFDLTHHLTFGNVWLPTFLWKLPIPFIWGPIGGYERIPPSFWKMFSLRGKVIEMLRYPLQFWAALYPISRMTARKAAMIIGRTVATSAVLSRDYPEKVMTMVETGIDQAELEQASAVSQKSAGIKAINVLMVGRLIPLKGFSLGIKAFKELAASDGRVKLHIIGSGPEEKDLKHLASSLGMEENVIFHGQLPHDAVLAHYKKADIFLHPSLKDAGAWVIFEAMAAGLPVVCFNYAGPGEIVTDFSGIKVRQNLQGK